MVCKAVACLFLVLPAVARQQAFTKITIKRSSSVDPRNARLRVLPNGDVTASAVPVITLLSFAYDVPSNPSPRLIGLSGWTGRYDVEAAAPTETVLRSITGDDMRRRAQQMVRQLLADGFGLVIRVESKRMSAYALFVAEGGPNLQNSSVADRECVFDTDPEGCHNFMPGFGHPLHARAIDTDDIAHYIENWTDLPVVNRTKLRGLFTVNTEGWVPMRLPPPPPGVTPEANPFVGLPTIFTVLGKLGLELKRQEEILPVYTVERIQHPFRN